MNILLDTNILIPLEDTSRVLDTPFAELRKLSAEQKHCLYIHPIQLLDISRDKNEERKNIVKSRLAQYIQIENPPILSEKECTELGLRQANENDKVDNNVLFALYRGAVHILVTNDEGIHRKASKIGIQDKVYRLEQFIQSLKLQAIKNFDLNDVPLYLNMQPTLRFAYIKEQCEYLVKEKGVKIIFIETIQSMFNYEENGNTKEDMETLCHKLKCLASELNVPIVITSDLNRSPEHREGFDGKVPQTADLRSCSAIENSADSIYLLFRPDYYAIRTDETGKDIRGIMNIIIAKKKYNHCGEVEVKFDRNSGRVYNLEKTTLCDLANPVEFNIHTHTDGPF